MTRLKWALALAVVAATGAVTDAGPIRDRLNARRGCGGFKSRPVASVVARPVVAVTSAVRTLAAPVRSCADGTCKVK